MNFMDEEVKKKIDEIAKKNDARNKAKELAEKQEEDERLRHDREFQEEKENILKEIRQELSEFEPKLLPLRRRLLDNREFCNISNTRFSIVATEDKRIEISVSSGRYQGNPDIYSLANDPQFKENILDILRFFLIGLKQFEKYYADNVEKYLKQ
jgi:hypothetical protein